ncbi:MAG: hypothetical protein AAB276_01040, partial [Pseudomonadota bacterium]
MKLIFQGSATEFYPRGLPFSTLISVPRKSSSLLINGEEAPSTNAWLDRVRQVTLALGIANCAYMIMDQNVEPERIQIKFFFEKETSIPPFLMAVIGNKKGHFTRYLNAKDNIESQKQEDSLKEFLSTHEISAGIFRTEPSTIMVTTAQRYDDLAILAHMIDFKSK